LNGGKNVLDPRFSPYQIELDDKAIDDLSELTQTEAEHVGNSIRRMAETGTGSIERMQGYYLMRLKVPPFRVVFSIAGRLITVVLIDARDQVYSKRNLSRLKPYRK
jgi:mRNA-degrading endonuclease RelE of RelBE toxin-antitoxin system